MKVQDARECFYESTAKTSDIVRQLAFAGIAVVWIFHVGDSAALLLPLPLLKALWCLCLTLSLDFFQYFSKSVVWGLYHRRKENQLDRDGIDADCAAGQFKAPLWINWPANGFFYAKCAALGLSAYFIAAHLHMVMKAATGQ